MGLGAVFNPSEPGRAIALELRIIDPFSRTVMPADIRNPDAAMDPSSLYREEIVTDRRVGTLRLMAPIKSDGTADTSRPTIYTGEAQIMTNMGALPVSFDIEATTLAEAVEKYGESAKTGIERTMRELQEMRRQQSSGLIVPPAGTASALAGGMGGGMPGGKIQMP